MTMRSLKIYRNTVILVFITAFTLYLQAQSDPNPASDGTLRRIHVPILMYHYVSHPPEDADDVRLNLTIDPQTFQQHIQFLAERGYNTITFRQLDNALRSGIPLPQKPIILTFDDGHLDHYTTVFPILRQHNLTGTFFIVTGFADANLPQYMNWAQIKEMAQAGMSMQPHTKNHISLHERSHDILVYQILGSVQSLSHFTQQDAVAFAYPAGRYDANTIDVVRSAGIQRAVTTAFGSLHTTDNRYEMTRLRITNETGIAALQALLTIRE